MKNAEKFKERFVELYGDSTHDIRVFHAPGRINLIGEHTDYNGGYVFPAALSIGTTMIARKRDDGRLNLASDNFPLRADVPIDDIRYDEADGWANYPKGVIRHLQQKGYHFGGYDLWFHGEIPNGSGLSSSASVEVVTGFGLLVSEGYEADKKEIAQVAQQAENEFNGVNCGIMDQFAVAMGKRDHAILLMCDTLEYRYVPFRSSEYCIMIAHTNKKRELADSAYNLRRKQCEQAVDQLRDAFPGLKLLGELKPEQFHPQAYRIEDEIVRNRARHVIEENARVLLSIAALEGNDLPAFGRLMTASHRSLRDLYAVTGKELDVMVDAALDTEGVLGSRMTGAGFGGCTVSLIRKDAIEHFRRKVGQAYREQTGLTAEFYACDIGDGVQEWEKE